MFTRIKGATVGANMPRLRTLFATTIAATAAATAAHAGVLYQSIPDLAAAPFVNGFCSVCESDNGQTIGQSFSLGRSAVAKTVSFDVSSMPVSRYSWPAPVTVSIYAAGAGGRVGDLRYSQTFSTPTFVSDMPTGHSTDIVTVDIGSVALTAGTYQIYFTNPAYLLLPGYDEVAGYEYNSYGMRVQSDLYSPPIPGLSHYATVYGQEIGVSISGIIPEPSTWAMMAIGFAGLAFAGCRMRQFPA